MAKSKRVEDIRVGDCVEFTKKLTESDILHFEGAIGDPSCHCAAGDVGSGSAPLKGVACELLSAGLIYTAAGLLLPGDGRRYLSQTLHFRKPVFAGDTVTANVTVMDLHEMSNWVSLSTVCRNQRGDIVTEGEAIFMPHRD